MFEKYTEYIKDNPQGLWFKRKLYGWGWTPVRWQGWVVVLAYVALIVIFASSVSWATSVKEVSIMFVLPVILLTSALIRICYTKGEKPRWQWGIPKEISKEGQE